VSSSAVLAQDKPEAGIGRYDIVCTEDDRMWMIDTTTGECWSREVKEAFKEVKWVSLKFPVIDTKVTKGACGRFRLRGNNKGDEEVTVWDTVDGRCWRRYQPIMGGGPKWELIPSPASK
jgi:hypothetical protein